MRSDAYRASFVSSKRRQMSASLLNNVFNRGYGLFSSRKAKKTKFNRRKVFLTLNGFIEIKPFKANFFNVRFFLKNGETCFEIFRFRSTDIQHLKKQSLTDLKKAQRWQLEYLLLLSISTTL